MAYCQRMQQPERPPRSDATVVAVGVAAIVLVMIGVGVASYYAGRDNRSTTGAAVSSASGPGSGCRVLTGRRRRARLRPVRLRPVPRRSRGRRGLAGRARAPDPCAGLTSPSCVDDQPRRRRLQRPTRPFMPVWHGVIAKQQIDALVAYMKAGFPAVQDAPQPAPANQGDAVEERRCISDTDASTATGRMASEASEPAVTRHRDPAAGRGSISTPVQRQAIADVIRCGSVIGKAPIVSMPHWGSILTDKQITQLVAYIDSLSDVEVGRRCRANHHPCCTGVPPLTRPALSRYRVCRLPDRSVASHQGWYGSMDGRAR